MYIPLLFKLIVLIVPSFLLIGVSLYVMRREYSSIDFYTQLSAVSTTFAAVGGISLLFVTYLTFSDSKKQRIVEKEPIVTLSLVPDTKNSNFVNFSIKNTGGGPAENRAPVLETILFIINKCML
ncbi:hypothetical protein [Planococcus maitriensis]|uniref:hypothetical protein n=1 Tax=Planococcus maitriensis TaxID=221799 RepID=UPI0011BDB310|nr:hypothetical protein [Planococcus maitriensis]